MSKKPEKKDNQDGTDYWIKRGYNQAIDDFEKFLPSEDEILELIYKVTLGKDAVDETDLAKAIAKRIGGKG